MPGWSLFSMMSNLPAASTSTSRWLIVTTRGFAALVNNVPVTLRDDPSAAIASTPRSSV